MLNLSHSCNDFLLGFCFVLLFSFTHIKFNSNSCKKIKKPNKQTKKNPEKPQPSGDEMNTTDGFHEIFL